ncbi:MAG: hypothetical protein O7A71_09250, partial [Chloroflexi bacterium]|nr:hypothetical protein [Chloroflexota bacterium]
MKAPQDLEFTPPDDAVWEIDSLHSPRPLTAMGESIFCEPQTEGWRSLAERYGMLVNGPERRTVHRFGYTTLRGAIGSGKPSGPPRRWQLWLALRLHPVLRARRAAANRAWKGQLWRDDLRLWDTEAKPLNIARHRQLLALELESLTDAELATHIEECHLQACDMARQHAYFNGVAFNPLGDFLAHVLDWTGLEGPEVITLFQGLSPLSSGWVPELDALVEALRDDSEAQEILGSERGAGEMLNALLALPGPVGDATAAYRDVVGYRVVGGYDVGDPCAIESPALLVGAIRKAVAGEARVLSPDAKRETAELRSRVPDQHRAQFDELLDYARQTFRVRDERALYTDTCAVGILRRALLAGGERLTERGRLQSSEHFVEATLEEATALLRTGDGPSDAELAERERYRLSYSYLDAPARLGPEPGASAPLEWLPNDGLLRGTRAMVALLSNLLDPADTGLHEVGVRGTPASVG